MGFSSTLNSLQSKHCPHKCVDVEVSGVYAALIKEMQVFPVNLNITSCLFCLQPSFSMVSHPKEVYDVPSQARRTSLFTVSSRKHTQENASTVVIFCHFSGYSSDVFTVTVMFYFQVSTTPRHMPRTHSLLPISELEKRFDSPETSRCSSPGDAYVSLRHLEGLTKQGTYDVLTLKCSLSFTFFKYSSPTLKVKYA